MILTKDELLTALRGEIRVLLHLASKVDDTSLNFRPTPKQRSTLELLQYLTVMGPIHAGAIRVDKFDLEAWKTAWTTGEATARSLTLDGAKAAIAKLPDLYQELIGSCSEEALRAEFEIFGGKSTRGALFVTMVLSHHAAYRMQLFMNLKASGREELNTFNLWAGMDGKM